MADNANVGPISIGSSDRAHVALQVFRDIERSKTLPASKSYQPISAKPSCAHDDAMCREGAAFKRALCEVCTSYGLRHEAARA